MSNGDTVRRLLVRYLSQRRELGLRDLYLERDRETVLAGLASVVRAPGPETPMSSDGASVSAEGATVDEFESFRSDVLGCTRCRLAESRKTVVFGEGDRNADLLVVGEAPGHEEDRTGRPFVGPAGQLLDKMLLAIGFSRPEVFICNVLKCRPPGNRDPWPDEVASCRPYLVKQVEMIRPKAICAFGRFASQTVLGSDQSLGRMRGTVHRFTDTPVVVTYHPAALLRKPEWKRAAWEDLQMLRRVFDEAGGRPPRGDDG